RAPPLRHDLPRQHRRRAGPPAAAREVLPAMTTADIARPSVLIGARARRTAALSEALTWLCGGTLALNLLLMIGIVGLLAWNGFPSFGPHDLPELKLRGGGTLLGEIWEVDKRDAEVARPAVDRLRIKVGNRDVGGLDFAWVERKDVLAETRPAEAVMLER